MSRTVVDEHVRAGPMSASESFDLFAPGVIANPYPWYQLLRERSPIHYDDIRDVWVLSRFDDVHSALLNHRAFSNADGIGYARQSTSGMITSDPPEHTRLRKLVNRMFTPRVVAVLEQRITDIVSDLLDEAREKSEIDWISDLAIPLPITVIAELLGVDVADREDFRRWSNAIMGLIHGEHTPEHLAALDHDRRECIAYLVAEIAARHRSDSRSRDLISVLLEVSDGDQLSEKEVLAFCMLMLVAGNETTTNTIANGTLALHEHPDQMAILSRDPSLINSAVEETLRYDAPVQGLFRTLLSDVRLPSGELASGARVLLLYGSANRDSAKFEAAEEFRVARNPTGHTSFGAGIHACVGAALSRAELRILTSEIHTRRLSVLPNGANVRATTPGHRGLTSMPVRVF